MLTTVKALVKRTPIMGPFLVSLRRRPKQFRNSSEYWEQRYSAGGDSGSGSYNRLADFKASFLNEFVARHQIDSLIEFGSGDGAQLKLAIYPSYIGVDVSAKAIERCRELFAADPTKRFLQLGSLEPRTIADVSLSLDVVFHLVEDSVYEAYMSQLFESARKFVIVYSSNVDQDWPQKHVRHRRFTSWVEENKPDWCLHSMLKNAYPYDPSDPEQTSFADFYIFAPR
jgi:hypothetical protein